MRFAVLIVALAIGAASGAEEIKDASLLETAAKGTSMGEISDASLLETAAKTARATGGSYTVSASALKARVKAESEKVEKFRAESGNYGMAHVMKEMESMTEADRLKDMAAMVLHKEGEKSGEEIIKGLNPQARQSLAQLQRLFTTSTAQLLDTLSTTDSVNKPGGMDPTRAERLKKDLAPIGQLMHPLMSHIELANDKHPELKPFTKQVGTMMSLFEEKALNELFQTNLPELQEFKRETFVNYTPEHKAQLEEVCEYIGANDLLTVLRDPNL